MHWTEGRIWYAVSNKNQANSLNSLKLTWDFFVVLYYNNFTLESIHVYWSEAIQVDLSVSWYRITRVDLSVFKLT